MSLIRGNALALPLVDASVDLVVTSPPYFALRSYTDDGEHYDGQIGSEDTPQAFLEALWAVTAECVRVLKPSGSIWVNLGDKYAGGGGQWEKDERPDPGGRRSSKATGSTRSNYTAGKTFGYRHKSLMGLPWRYAIGCIDQLGLILRAEVIWAKPNGLPESVTDRVRRSHEQWFMFTKEPRYFSAVDEIREPQTSAVNHYAKHSRARHDAPEDERDQTRGTLTFQMDTPNPLGKLPGSVWTIPTEPLRVPDGLPQHFAAFPSEWPRRIILGWSPSGVCVECGEGRRPRRGTICDECGAFRPNQAKACPECGHVRDWKAGRVQSDEMGSHDWSTAGHGTPRHPGGHEDRSVAGGDACACPTPDAPTRPSVVLDPFAGTGTVPAVAQALGRHGIGVDLSADYLKLARWRCNDPGLRAKVLGVKKPPKELDGQLDLLGDAA